jgi:hypothetical protein
MIKLECQPKSIKSAAFFNGSTISTHFASGVAHDDTPIILVDLKQQEPIFCRLLQQYSLDL